MRRLFLIAGLMTALGLAVAAASAFAPANFAGTWSLDKAKSQGLDPRMQNAESVTWTITQDDKQISIESKVVAGAPPAGAPTTWSSDGKTLELSAVRAGSRDGQEFKFTTVEKLSLSGDGKLLTVARHGESPRGPQDSTLVFNKQ